MNTTAGIGDPAPDCALVLATGVRPLSAWRGHWLVLYFYPKDATPGCTTQARAFAMRSDDFAASGAHILGVSRDSLAAHARFAARESLPFPLAADEEGTVCAAFGTWVEKSLYGRRYMGVERSTFLIDPHGQITQVWRKVKVAGHVDSVYAALVQARQT